jgi:hypothetical protein
VFRGLFAPTKQSCQGLRELCSLKAKPGVLGTSPHGAACLSLGVRGAKLPLELRPGVLGGGRKAKLSHLPHFLISKRSFASLLIPPKPSGQISSPALGGLLIWPPKHPALWAAPPKGGLVGAHSPFGAAPKGQGVRGAELPTTFGGSLGRGSKAPLSPSEIRISRPAALGSFAPQPPSGVGPGPGTPPPLEFSLLYYVSTRKMMMETGTPKGEYLSKKRRIREDKNRFTKKNQF